MALVVERAQRVNVLLLLDLEEFGLQLLHHLGVPLGVLLRLACTTCAKVAAFCWASSAVHPA